MALPYAEVYNSNSGALPMNPQPPTPAWRKACYTVTTQSPLPSTRQGLQQLTTPGSESLWEIQAKSIAICEAAAAGALAAAATIPGGPMPEPDSIDTGIPDCWTQRQLPESAQRSVALPAHLLEPLSSELDPSTHAAQHSMLSSLLFKMQGEMLMDQVACMQQGQQQRGQPFQQAQHRRQQQQTAVRDWGVARQHKQPPCLPVVPEEAAAATLAGTSALQKLVISCNDHNSNSSSCMTPAGPQHSNADPATTPVWHGTPAAAFSPLGGFSSNDFNNNGTPAAHVGLLSHTSKEGGDASAPALGAAATAAPAAVAAAPRPLMLPRPLLLLSGLPALPSRGFSCFLRDTGAAGAGMQQQQASTQQPQASTAVKAAAGSTSAPKQGAQLPHRQPPAQHVPPASFTCGVTALVSTSKRSAAAAEALADACYQIAAEQGTPPGARSSVARLLAAAAVQAVATTEVATAAAAYQGQHSGFISTDACGSVPGMVARNCKVDFSSAQDDELAFYAGAQSAPYPPAFNYGSPLPAQLQETAFAGHMAVQDSDSGLSMQMQHMQMEAAEGYWGPGVFGTPAAQGVSSWAVGCNTQNLVATGPTYNFWQQQQQQQELRCYTTPAPEPIFAAADSPCYDDDASAQSCLPFAQLTKETQLPFNAGQQYKAAGQGRAHTVAATEEDYTDILEDLHIPVAAAGQGSASADKDTLMLDMDTLLSGMDALMSDMHTPRAAQQFAGAGQADADVFSAEAAVLGPGATTPAAAVGDNRRSYGHCYTVTTGSPVSKPPKRSGGSSSKRKRTPGAASCLGPSRAHCAGQAASGLQPTRLSYHYAGGSNNSGGQEQAGGSDNIWGEGQPGGNTNSWGEERPTKRRMSLHGP